jgi:hypothetical protein
MPLVFAKIMSDSCIPFKVHSLLRFCFLICLLSHLRLLGTPNELVWPGVQKLRDWHDYPQWQPQNLARAVPDLDPLGLDLLKVSHFPKYMYEFTSSTSPSF